MSIRRRILDRPSGVAFVILFGAAVLTSLPIWWLHAWPVLTFASLGDHARHYGLLYVHALGGTAMLTAGGVALYMGWTGRRGRPHKIFGYAYIVGGGVGAIAALAMSLRPAHVPHSLGVATATLSIVWLVFAAMAWRAAWNRRFDSHREWTIRSYVVTWTFVGCRIAQLAPPFPSLGLEGVTAGIWLYWIAPILICEVALQWTRGGPEIRRGG
jgi:hypothetical protein